jgi:hypothetical protein
MTFDTVLFVVLAVTTFISNGVQGYIHFEAYPLIPFVGTAELPSYLKEYERRLALPLLVPYAVMVLSNIGLLFIRPAKLCLMCIIVALVLNLAVTLVTMTLATPVYNRIKQNGQALPNDMQRLLRIDLLRLLLSTISSGLVIYLLLELLS